MRPYFRNGDYGGGLLAGATEIAARIARERNVDIGVAQPEPARSGRRGVRLPAGFWFILVILILRAISRRGGGPRSGRRSWSSGVGPFVAGYGMGASAAADGAAADLAAAAGGFGGVDRVVVVRSVLVMKGLETIRA
jgi:uncharacterized membrane protein YgcG